MTLRMVLLSLMFAVATLSATVSAAPAQDPTTSTAAVSSAQQHLATARQAMKDGDYRLLEKSLKKARKANPELAEVYRLWGDYHTLFNRAWKAEKLYKKAEELEQLQAKKDGSAKKAAGGQ